VTIAAGFRCINGIVLCSDSQYTTWYGKYHGSKIFQFFPQNGVVLVAFAGVIDYMGEVKERIAKNVDGFIVTEESVRALVRCTLDSFLPREGEMFQILTAFSLDVCQAKICVSNRASDMNATFRRVEGYDLIGCGSSPLTHYLVGLFSRMPTMTIEQAGLLGLYVVRQASKYGADGIGGPIQLYAINERGVVVTPFREIPEEQEKRLGEVEYNLALLLSYLTDGRYPEKDFDTLLQTFALRMRDFRQKLIGSPVF